MARVRYCQVERFPNINQNRKYVNNFISIFFYPEEVAAGLFCMMQISRFLDLKK